MNKHDLRKGMLVKALRNMELYNFNPLYNNFISVEQLIPVAHDEILMIMSIELNRNKSPVLRRIPRLVAGHQDVYGLLFYEKIVFASFYFENETNNNFNFFDSWKVLI